MNANNTKIVRDLVVVGGGIAGCTAAMAAARLGMQVALVQNRPVLGGNASSEIGLLMGGAHRDFPHARERPLLLISFTGPAHKLPRGQWRGMQFTGAEGRLSTGYGMFGALSFDEGATWDFVNQTTRPWAPDGHRLCEPTQAWRLPDGTLARLWRDLSKGVRGQPSTSDLSSWT